MSSSTSQPNDWSWSLSKAKVLLKDDSAVVDIRITEVSSDSFHTTSYLTPVEVRAALSRESTDKAKLRIISIYSRKTISPLGITQDILIDLFDACNIHKEFADIIASFGQEPNIAERSCDNATLDVTESGDCKISYQIRYVERNQRGGQDPWSLRHSGVFHHHSAQNGTDILILLHPVREPLVEKAILALRDDARQRLQVCSNPFLLHTWIFSQYFENWRWYLRDIGERFAKENNMAMVVQPEHADPHTSFGRVQELRNTMDLILSARACCSGNLDLMHCMSESSLPVLQKLSGLKTGISRVKGYIESADMLKGRIQNLIDLVGYTLTLHNQMEAAKIDTELRNLTQKLKDLTEDTVDDSATVKIITFVSAVYLPGSFVATLFGMNFFLFNADSRKLEISPSFWIFIATWLPLIFITGAIYVLILFIDSRIKGKPFRLAWRKQSSTPNDTSPGKPRL